MRRKAHLSFSLSRCLYFPLPALPIVSSLFLSLSLSLLFFFFFFFLVTHFGLHCHNDRVVRTPALLCRLEFRSFESSGSRQGAPSPFALQPLDLWHPPLTFANPRRPLFFVTCRLFGFSLSLCLSVCLSFSPFLPLFLSVPCANSVPFSRGLWLSLSLSFLVLSSVFLPSHLAAPANCSSLCLTRGNSSLSHLW